MSEVPLPDGYAYTDIAIVGMAGRFPGAPDVDAFWSNIREGVDAGARLEPDALREAGATEEELADPGYVPVTYAIDDMEGFDHGFFGMSPREAAIMDPQQRHFLELAWAAFEHAGHDPSRPPGPVGVFAGCGASLYLMRNLLTNRDLAEQVGFFLLRHTGNDKDFLATRVSYLLNLTGPSVSVQTACSTGLVAVHLACQSLLMNECDVALAGGATYKQPHRVGYVYQEGEIMSEDGRCRSFDASATGTVFGSGAGAVVLRRLEDALRDGDTIHAVIKGTAINNDGSAKVGYLAPSVDAQARNMAEALAVAGIDPTQVGYVECHGTATPVGDPIEVTALNQAFAEFEAEPASIAIGSVKTNIGHLDTAAGIAGLIKTVRALEAAELPPSLHYEAPNPAIDFESGPFYVNAKLQPWPRKGPHRLAAVGALGAGGTNAHVVLQSAPPAGVRPASGGAWRLYPLSAKTESALDRRSGDLAAWVRSAGPEPGDVAHTLQSGRFPFARRRVVAARTADELAERLAGDASLSISGEATGERRSSVFMFAGGGAQYPGMGRDLYERLPAYRDAVDECVRLLQPSLDWSLTSLLYAAPESLEAAAEEMRRPSRSLPCLFITQYAMAKLLMSWGLEPDAMIGHSMGEYTAAHLAGVFSLQDALALVSKRGQLFETVPPGGMLSVPLDAAELATRLPKELSIAADNAPGLSVASGPVAALDALEAELLAEDIEGSRIHIDIAAHSSMLEGILEEFEAFCRGIAYSAPERRFVSNLSGGWIEAAEATDPKYWVRHLRETVRFADGVETLLSDPGRALIEVGPGRTLTTLAGLHGSFASTHVKTTTMRHPDEQIDDVEAALGAVGRLWVAGVDVEWSRLSGDEPSVRIPLPTYPFEHERHFFEPGEIAAPKPSLARRADVGSWFWRPSWRREPVRMGVPSRDTEQAWLVLHDDAGLGADLVRSLRSTGATVVSVLAGDAFDRVDQRTFRAAPGSDEDLKEVLSSVSADGPIPTRIVHAWAAGEGPVGTDRAFFSLLGLVEALDHAGAEEGTRIDVVTAGAQYVGGEPALDPERALVTGPVRVTPKEFPDLRCRAIDVAAGPGSAPDRRVRQLLAELSHDSDDEMVAWRGSERFVQSFEPVPLAPVEDDGLDLGDGAVWLLTGGLGGLGLRVARELAERARVRLVLVGRRASRPPEVDALEELGAEVLIVQADVTDEADMRRVVETTHRNFGRINGIVHAAGVVEDALILMKERESAERVLAPKVRGSQVLRSVTDGEPLERIVFFSSRGAFAGVAGQVDYTSASAYLDAHALLLSEIHGLPAISLNWSAWQGVGIAAGGSSAGRPVEHPLLDRCTVESDEAAVYHSRLSPRSHWLLDEHRLRSGEALIPGTGYLELLAAVAAESADRSSTEIQDVFFFSPFMVPEDGARDLRVSAERDGSDWEVVIEGSVPDAGAWEEHSRGAIVAVDRARPTLDVAAVRGRCTARSVSFEVDQQRNANLLLGHRWSNLERLDFGEAEALAELALPEEFVGETGSYRMHPALLDVACACAQELVPGFDTTTQFFIPVSYGRVTLFERLPSRCFSHIRLKPGAGPESDTAVYDITIATVDGTVLVDIADFTMMRVAERVGAAEPAQVSAAAADKPLQMEGAIEPDEGVDALLRVFASGISGQLVVSPQHLEAYLEALRAPPEQAPPPPAAPMLDLIDATEVEDALARHESVDEVAVLAHEDASGEVRSTAFVVWELGEEVTIAEFVRFLSGKVPEALVPEQIVEMEALPRTPDGDVDRRALPDPFAPKDDFVGPTTETERAIAAIWMELLGVSRVSVHDNFLDVGGHSLLAMRAVSKIAKQTGVRLNPSVMTLNTLGQIAAECDNTVGAAS